MEFRKLIEFGKSSFVVSLPKGWVEKNKLCKGDVLYIEEKRTELVVYPKENIREKEFKTIVINSENKDPYAVESEIISAYLNNFDSIIIKGKDVKSNAPRIKEMLQNLAGIELMEQSIDKISTKNLLNLEDISIKSIIQRVDIIIRSMIKDSMNSIHEDYYESIKNRDSDVNRLVFLTKRVIRSAMDDVTIAKKLNAKTNELFLDWQMINYLESIGDEVKRLSRLLKQIDPSTKRFKELSKLNKIIGEKYIEMMKAYHTNNRKRAFDIESGTKKRMDVFQKVLSQNLDLDSVFIIGRFKSMNSIIKNMARMVIDRTCPK